MAGSALAPEQLKDLLARGQRGDEAACAALVQHFGAPILRLALGLLGNVQDAEEVSQDAWVYALRNLGRYDPHKSAFATWLYTITLSRCRNKRRRKLLAMLPLDLLATQTPRRSERVVETLLERRGVREQVWEALQALPPRLHEAVALRFLAELRYKEIGAALGCNPKTAESRVRLGLEQMRQSLQAIGVEPESEPAEQWVW